MTNTGTEAKSVDDILAIMRNRGVTTIVSRQEAIAEKNKNRPFNLQLPDRKSTRLNSSHVSESRMPSSA